LLDYNTLASGSGSADRRTGSEISVWDLRKRTVSYTLRNNEALALCVKEIKCLLPLRKDLLACCGAESGEIEVWCLPRKTILYVLKGHTETVNDLKLLDEDTMASCSEDQSVRIWDVKRRACTREIKLGVAVRTLCLVDRSTLLGGCSLGSVQIVDLASGKVDGTLGKHGLQVSYLAVFAPNVVISGCLMDQSLKFWHVKERKCVHTLTGLWHGTASFAVLQLE